MCGMDVVAAWLICQYTTVKKRRRAIVAHTRPTRPIKVSANPAAGGADTSHALPRWTRGAF